MGMIQENPNDRVYDELIEIKKLLAKVIEVLAEVRSLEEDIKVFEGHQAEDEDKIVKAVKKRRFSSVFEWKNAIWERCPNRKQQSSEDTVSFYCTILKGPCMFENCPRNFVDDDPYKTNY
jgi:hypothetical protein